MATEEQNDASTELALGQLDCSLRNTYHQFTRPDLLIQPSDWLWYFWFTANWPLLVHRKITIIFVVSVCLFVCAEFFSAVFDPIWIKLGHMLHVRV